MAAAVCGDDAGDVSAGAGGVWGVGGGGEDRVRAGWAGYESDSVSASFCCGMQLPITEIASNGPISRDSLLRMELSMLWMGLMMLLPLDKKAVCRYLTQRSGNLKARNCGISWPTLSWCVYWSNNAHWSEEASGSDRLAANVGSHAACVAFRGGDCFF